MSLFDQEPPRSRDPEANLNTSSESPTDSTPAPLAARMRPQRLEEFVGQQAILGAGKLLRQAIESDSLSSAIFWGPPGCGKSTLAFVIARSTRAAFETLSAVTSGVADVRRVIAAASERRERGIRTVLFVDEIHRFNRSQQDAFLPDVEEGAVILIGATTENPYFAVNSPLLSRARVFRFEPLEEADLEQLLDRALRDEDRGLGGLRVKLDSDARKHLLQSCGGDARSLLNALEAAAIAVTLRSQERVITLGVAEDAVQRRLVQYDRSGDNHYDVTSAFIKSLRGPDPDAALYWMARMLTAGEDPRFVVRRLIVHAAEDVGNADPLALMIATSAAQALDWVGLPEARIPIAQAVIYIACAPKSNATVVAIGRALEDAERGQARPVPPHLRDSHYRGASQLGHGAGYQYPHDFPDHFVEQDYLPEGALSGVYYEPSDQGREKAIGERLASWRARRNARKRRPLDHGESGKREQNEER